MKKAAFLSLAIAIGFTLMAGRLWAADKLAYVDLSRLFAEYGKTKEYDKTLEAKENSYNTEREKKVDEVKQFQDKLNLLSEKEREAKKAEMENKIKGLQEYDRQKQTDLRKDQDEKMKEILKDIETAVKEVAQKDGYTIVFNDRVLVYQDKGYDITDKALAALNKNYSKKQ